MVVDGQCDPGPDVALKNVGRRLRLIEQGLGLFVDGCLVGVRLLRFRPIQGMQQAADHEMPVIRNFPHHGDEL